MEVLLDVPSLTVTSIFCRRHFRYFRGFFSCSVANVRVWVEDQLNQFSSQVPVWLVVVLWPGMPSSEKPELQNFSG